MATTLPDSAIPNRRIRDRYLRMYATLQRAKVTGELSDATIAICEARLRVWAAQRCLAALLALRFFGGGRAGRSRSADARRTMSIGMFV